MGDIFMINFLWRRIDDEDEIYNLIVSPISIIRFYTKSSYN